VDVDQELDRLYGLPLDEFTKARDALARELRTGGERDAADEVKALAKPSVSAWTANQLARRERLQVRALLTAGEGLRAAQETLLRGGSPDDLQAALGRQRDAVAALVESGRALLEEAGRPATDATVERLRTTLTAAAADEAGARLLEQGRLTHDLEPAGFGGLAPVPAGARAPRRPRAGKATAKERREAEQRARRIDEAKQELDRLGSAAAEQKATVRAAKAASRAAEREEAKAQADLERLTEQLDAARAALERARRTP
jgi:hypothetical protein